VIALAEDGEHVIVVVNGLEVEEKGRVAQHAERSRAEERSLHAVRGAVAENSPGGAAGGAAGLLVVGEVHIQESLNLRGRVQAAEHGAFGWGEGVGGHSAQVN
jgi:hypothetical protein